MLFEGQEHRFYARRHFGKYAADIRLLFGRNNHIATVHAAHQRASEVGFQPIVYLCLRIARKCAITPAHAARKAPELPQVKLGAMVVAARLRYALRVGNVDKG